MEHDSERDAVHAAITTAEHQSIGNVLDVIRRLEELRARGLSSAQVSERIRLTHPNRPGGGPWSAEAVERVLEIADTSRRQAEREPVTRPIPKAVATPATSGDNPFNPGQSVGQPPLAYPPPRARGGDGADRLDEHRAPLRVEPRRYHRRPASAADVAPEVPEARRWRPILAGLLVLAGLIAVGAGLYRGGAFDRLTGTDEQAESAAVDPVDGEVSDDTADPSTGETSAEPTPMEEADGESTGQAAEEGSADDDTTSDRLTVRIEPSTPESDGEIAPATATIRSDGKLYVEGAFRSASEAEQFLTSASGVFGAEALVTDYTIDPAAPDPTVSDVTLEKPIMFESGSAVIEPEYIPFLEACGDVLKLNSHIVMSVAAFTDASGDAEFNLELSQQRADAVIEFYRNLDIGDDQLISTGFGENNFVADNSTEEGRQQNRRAMLELLNVMKDS